MKTCTQCGREKPAGDFYRQSSQKSGLNPRCKPCVNAFNRAYQARNAERMNTWKSRAAVRRWAKSALGLSQAEYEACLRRAHGCCEACGRSESTVSRNGTRYTLAFDHDHTTMKFRGMLCRPCNTALGCVDDDPSLLRKLADYIETGGVPAPLLVTDPIAKATHNHSAETRAKIAASAAGNQRTVGLKHPPRSPEWLAKQSEAQKQAWARRRSTG